MIESNVAREALVTRRKELGLTQKQVGDCLGLHYRTISRWENGLSTPELNPGDMAKLCNLLQCSIEELAEMFSPSQLKCD